MKDVTIVNAVVTLVFINPPTTASLEIVRVWCSQTGSTTSAMQQVNLVTQVTAFPTLTSTTPVPLKIKDPASIVTGATSGAAGTSGTNASAEGGGAKTVVWADAFNVLNGWLWVSTPNETIIMNAGAASGLGLYLPTAATSLTHWTAGLVFREL